MSDTSDAAHQQLLAWEAADTMESDLNELRHDAHDSAVTNDSSSELFTDPMLANEARLLPMLHGLAPAQAADGET